MNLNSFLDSFPDPWNWRFLALIVSASVIATDVAAFRATGHGLVPGAIILVVCLLSVIGGRMFVKSNSPVRTRPVKLYLAPLLLGVPPLATAIAVGDPGAGGYPTALSVLLGYILMITHDLELRARVEGGDSPEFPVHTVYHGALSWVSTVFFFFGVATLWPWLGEIYSGYYFWILVIGVLMPTLYLWGRLRQPRKQNSYAALIRFNRVLPYIGLILLIAILVG